MFRQINVNPAHWNYQRFLWRPDRTGPIRENFITVVVWGITSGTINAERAMQQCAIDHEAEFHLSSKATLEDFYVDNPLSGVDSKDELVKLQQQMVDLHKAGGFQLSQWSTNSALLFKDPSAESARELLLVSDLDCWV